MYHPLTDLDLQRRRHLDLVRAAEQHRLARLARQGPRPPSGRPRRHPASQAVLVALTVTPYLVIGAAVQPVLPW